MLVLWHLVGQTQQSILKRIRDNFSRKNRIFRPANPRLCEFDESGGSRIVVIVDQEKRAGFTIRSVGVARNG
jgi:hypothetical protein